MRRILNVLTHTRTLSIIGLLALAAVLFIGADTLQIDLMWPAIGDCPMAAGLGGAPPARAARE
jgi:type VI protein secretion system component VasK